MSKRILSIDDLPAHSPWPARLLGLKEWKTKTRTAEELTREYEGEKWGPLLNRIKQSGNGVNLQQVDQWQFQGLPPQFCSLEDHFELMSATEAHEHYLDLVEKKLKPFTPAKALVELGAGYGTVILALAQRAPFSGMDIRAGEYAQSGVDIIKILGTAQNQKVVAGHCDFAAAKMVDFEIPAGSLIFTSMATPCVSHLTSAFIDQLLSYRPKTVVHFEPCYEHCDETTSLGLMRKRYIEVNDYNRNLLTVLREQQAKGRIKILEETPAVFGSNALLACSIVVWEPTR